MSAQLFDDMVYEQVNAGLKRKIVHTDHLMSVLLDFSGGPWKEAEEMHYHPHEQVSFISSGAIRFFMEGEEPVDLKSGDFFAVPGNCRHGIQLMSKEARIIDNFTPLREEFL